MRVIGPQMCFLHIIFFLVTPNVIYFDGKFKHQYKGQQIACSKVIGDCYHHNNHKGQQCQ